MVREDELPVDIVTVGELTLDDTVLESGDVQRATCGGGALYAAAGAHVWGLRVGINAVVGAEDYPEEALLRIAAAGLDIRGIRRWPGPSLRLWILHEDGARKQQVVKLGAATFAELDAARGPLPASYRAARGWHLAPATPQGQRQALDELCARESGVIVTDADGGALTAPLDTTSPVAWVGYANETLRRDIAPALQRLLGRMRVSG